MCWSAGACRRYLEMAHLTVPPIPSHGDFPWLVEKTPN